MDVIKKKHWWQSDALKWSVLGLLGLLVGYLVVLMYAQGEYLFAITTLILSSAGLYIFANRKAYAWRYVYPGMAGMGLFVLIPGRIRLSYLIRQQLPDATLTRLIRPTYVSIS